MRRCVVSEILTLHCILGVSSRCEKEVCIDDVSDWRPGVWLLGRGEGRGGKGLGEGVWRKD